MASANMDAATLEFFVKDSLLADFEEQDLKDLVKVLEPIREDIELHMDGYAADKRGWREYRYTIWDFIESVHPELDQQFETLANNLYIWKRHETYEN